MTDFPPTLSDIEAAAQRLAGHAVKTPLLKVPDFEPGIPGGLLVKPEVLQRTGSFKFRGAMNKIAQIPAGDRAKGVVAYSSGNHAQGVAAAAALNGVPATIIMPSDAPAIKRETTEALGAKVRLYDRWSEDREGLAAALVEETGATLVKPYDDPDIIAGQGTVGLEIVQSLEAAGEAMPDVVFCCCGGGGLIPGLATAFDALSPETEVYAVEPAGFDDTGRSLKAGERLGNAPGAASFCDALLAKQPGELTFAINRRLLAGGFSVTDSEVAAAMRFAFRRLKLVVEPGGAVALAAALSGKIDLTGKRCVAVMTGGNVDPTLFMDVLQGS